MSAPSFNGLLNEAAARQLGIGSTTGTVCFLAGRAVKA